jgi:hypothetical protein
MSNKEATGARQAAQAERQFVRGNAAELIGGKPKPAPAAKPPERYNGTQYKLTTTDEPPRLAYYRGGDPEKPEPDPPPPPDQRLKVADPDPNKWPNAVRKLALEHVLRNRPATTDALRRLFEPVLKISDRDLIACIRSSSSWKAMGVTVTDKGAIRYLDEPPAPKPEASTSAQPPRRPVREELVDDLDAELDAVFGKPNPPPELSHAGRNLSQPGQKTSHAGQKPPRVRHPEPRPDPAELQRQYDAGLPDWKRWQRNAQMHELGHLCQLRRRQCAIPREMEFLAWCASIGVDPQRWYSAATLSAKLQLTIDEDNIFGTNALGRWPIKQKIKHSVRVRTLRAGRFPTRFYPLNEPPKEREKRRRRIYRRMDKLNGKLKRKRETNMLNQETHTEVRTPPRLTKIEALINALPRAPGRIKLVDAAAKVRQHQTWRDKDGKMLAVRTVRNNVRGMATGCTSIGHQVVTEGSIQVAYLWRR